ncbi:hypothetical protein [Hyphomonas sp.]|uniref:hypothetical protein n=1 Tax=Hyphomonas sp. TaxID=87 RepID=UPI0025C2AF66|nr:hypothetical protein [Hyphomonas sp.]
MKTQLVTIAASLLLVASLGLGWWSHYLRSVDLKASADAGRPRININASSSTRIEIHNYYAPGERVPTNEKLADGWERSVYNEREFLRRVDNEIIDLGAVKVTTIAVLNDDQIVEWRYRIFSIIEGAAWDLDSWTVFRNADGDELSLEVLLNHKRIKEQIDVSDIVFSIGLASNLKGQTAGENLVLAGQRAEWLAMAIAKFSMVSGKHRWGASMGGTPAENSIHGKVFMVPLGEANKETELGDPDEPFQRAAIVVGVDIAERDPDLSEVLSFVVAPGVSITTDLSDYMLSRDPTKLMRQITDPRSFGEFRNWPSDYSVRNPEE